MSAKSTLTPKLRNNWLIDAALGLGTLIAILTGLYFLVFPVGGYQGGRNPYYDIVLLFDRQTWDLLHTWGSVVMILAALVHMVIHWHWLTGTAGRVWKVIVGKRKGFGLRLSYNILLDAVLALSFLVCMISGLYFLIFTSGGPEAPILLFDKITWDMIHTWSGVFLTFSAVLHFVLHWKWVVNITRKIFGGRSGVSLRAEEGMTKSVSDTGSVHL